MLLVVDIGNTLTKVGIYDNDLRLASAAFATDKTADAARFGSSVSSAVGSDFTTSIVSSVVPELNSAVIEALADIGGTEPLVVTNDLDFGFTIEYRPLEDAGSDRLINTFSAVERYGVPIIVCSFGTAMTLDHVDVGRVLTGGLIAPGMNTLAAALRLTTSRLPEVSIELPATRLQNTTVGSLRSGIVYGYFGLVEGLLAGIKQELGFDGKVIATGGFAPLIAENTSQIDIVDQDLMLDGLKALYDRNFAARQAPAKQQIGS